MKYEIGDRILLVHSKEEGTVVDIINDKMVMVEVGDTSFPVYLDQIDFPYFHRFTQKKTAPPPRKLPGEEIRTEQKKKHEVFRTEKGVSISMLPVFQHDGMEEGVQLLKFHVVNETALALQFHFQLWMKNGMELEMRNELLPWNHFYLTDVAFEALNDNPRFEFTFSLKEPNPKLARSFHKTWKMKPKQIFQHINELRIRRDATVNYPLFDKYPEWTPEETIQQKIEQKPVGSQYTIMGKTITLQPDSPVEPKEELDLHIEHLIKDHRGLSNIAILAIQLNEFQHYLDLAISHKLPRMVVIHGIGKGKLREELHAILKQTPEVNYYVNEYHPKYGYGATEVFFHSYR